MLDVASRLTRVLGNTGGIKRANPKEVWARGSHFEKGVVFEIKHDWPPHVVNWSACIRRRSRALRNIAARIQSSSTNSFHASSCPRASRQD
jgi:hypothetical protein